MINPKKQKQRWLLFAFAALPAAFSYAQDESEPVFELSPFEVDASGDVGYMANSTLAGSRLNTQLRDVAASVTVLTQEFMQDLGATDIDAAFAYVAGVETNQMVDASTTSSYVGGDIGDSNVTPGNNRVRGLDKADVTSDFFLVSNGHIDSYNVERIALVRGPNSVLFGLGSPAGIINYTTKKASLAKNFGELGIKVDHFGTLRTDIDQNYVLLEDKLAVRLMGLYQDKRTQFNTSFDRDRRGTIALTYRPFKRTTIRVGVEDVDINSRRPRYLAPKDRISGWIAAGRPTWDSFNNPGVNPPEGIDDLDGVNNGTLQLYTDMNSAEMDWFGRNGNLNNTGAFPSSGFVKFFRSADPAEATAFYVDSEVSDPKIFPIFDVDISALPGTSQKRNYQKKHLIINQNLAENLDLEVGFFKDDVVNDNFFHMIAQTNSINIDVNETLPDGSDNPNFLRPFIYGRGVRRYTQDEREGSRASLTYRLDFEDMTEKLGFLGEHRFNAVYSTTDHSNFWFPGNPRTIASNDAFQGDNGNHRTSIEAWYVGDPFLPGDAYPTYTGFPQVSRAYNVGNTFTYPDDTGTWVTMEGVEVNTYAPERYDWALTKVEGYGGSVQSYFWDNRIVTTLGWRKDEIESNSQRVTLEPNSVYDFKRVNEFPTEPGNDSGETMTKGAVFHATDWLSIHYNESENFRVGPAKVDLLLRPIAASSGEGKDYGFTVTAFDGKLVAKVNFYETAQQNVTNSGLGFVAFWRLRGFERGLYTRATRGDYPGVDWINWDGTTDNYDRAPNVSDVNDYVAEGIELEITYNPTSNWRIMFNASKQETVQSNTGVAMLEYIALRTPFWDQLWDLPWSSSRTVRQQWDSAVASRLDPALASNGKASLGQAEWSWSAVTNYRFSEGKLKGASVGASMRWSGERALGYGTMLTEAGKATTDISKPFFGDPVFNLGVHASYQKRILNNTVLWRIQLNIRNLIGDDKLEPNRINPDGSVASWRIGREKEFILSNSFKW